MAFTIKRGATRPTYVAQLLQNIGAPGLPNGEPVPDLDTATEIRFAMRYTQLAPEVAQVPDINDIMQVIDVEQAIVEYTWNNVDPEGGNGTINTEGDYDVEIWIVWALGVVEILPNDSFKVVTLKPSLNAL